MITYAQRAKSINEIRLVMRNPIQAIRLLKELKHGVTPTFSFVGYTKYYLNFGKKDINPILSLSLFPQKSRKSRQHLIFLQLLSTETAVFFLKRSQSSHWFCGLRLY